MSNMSYCRFENTARDLDDCARHILDNLDPRYEGPARRDLVETCVVILEKLGFIVETEDGDSVCPGAIEDAIEERAANGSEDDEEEGDPETDHDWSAKKIDYRDAEDPAVKWDEKFDDEKDPAKFGNT